MLCMLKPILLEVGEVRKQKYWGEIISNINQSFGKVPWIKSEISHRRKKVYMSTFVRVKSKSVSITKKGLVEAAQTIGTYLLRGSEETSTDSLANFKLQRELKSKVN